MSVTLAKEPRCGAFALRRSKRALLTIVSVCAVVATVGAQGAEGPTGKYGAVMEYDASVTPHHTVYRPRDMRNLKKIPIVAWGNGGCAANGGSTARQFLMQVASEGFLIIAPAKPGPDVEIRPADAAPPSPPPRRDGAAPPERPTGPAPTQSSDLTTAIDWALRENNRKDSIYYRKLDPNGIAVMGHSCGGLQALEASIDPRIKTAMIWNSGVFADSSRPLRGTSMTKEKLPSLHAPLAYIHGGPTDVAYPQAIDDFDRIAVPIFMGESDIGHGGTFRQLNGGEYAEIATAWLNWKLRNDKAAAKTFVGPDCALCTDARWKISKKAMD